MSQRSRIIRCLGATSFSPQAFGFNSCYSVRIKLIARAVESPSSSSHGSHATQGWTKVFSSSASPIHQLESVLGRFDDGPAIPQSRPIVLVVSGPSGVGKDSVLNRLREKRDDLYSVVTATSRERRPMEVEGRDYFFVSKAQFESWIHQDALLEHALVYGEYKGIPRQQVDNALAAGANVVLRIDVQGAATVKKLMPDAVLVFVAAESEATLVNRLAARQTETFEKLLVRVQTAKKEMEAIKDFDYVVVNREGGMDECADKIGAIIDAERSMIRKSI
jgi:guanylate kinase